MEQTLRRAGGSLVMTVPKAFIEQNKLHDGSRVQLELAGSQLTIRATRRPRYVLSELLAEMPAELPRVEGWDSLPAVGLESD
jgi:antitoxin ChpS